MAVYTQIDREQLARFLTDYDVGDLIDFAGIAQGVENSNYRVQTTKNLYILTLYEKRVAKSDLPFFVALMDHAAANNVPVPSTIMDKQGQSIKHLCGKPACLIEHMAGNTIDRPNADLAHKGGAALGGLHKALSNFNKVRPNSMGPKEWQRLAGICEQRLTDITQGEEIELTQTLHNILNQWPQDLPQSAIHADLFPDNLMTVEGEVSGIIDVYFACTDFRAYDLAVMHSAWCFDDEGGHFNADISANLLKGYAAIINLGEQEIAALPLLCQGASIRFFLSRAYDWLNTSADALVTPKNPMAYWRRLEFYSDTANAHIFSGALNNG
jgi:homoserine kinase type II